MNAYVLLLVHSAHITSLIQDASALVNILLVFCNVPNATHIARGPLL